MVPPRNRYLKRPLHKAMIFRENLPEIGGFFWWNMSISRELSLKKQGSNPMNEKCRIHQPKGWFQQQIWEFHQPNGDWTTKNRIKAVKNMDVRVKHRDWSIKNWDLTKKNGDSSPKDVEIIGKNHDVTSKNRELTCKNESFSYFGTKTGWNHLVKVVELYWDII